jgi:hypothetical protein
MARVFIEWLSKQRPALNGAKGGALTSTIRVRFHFRRIVKGYKRLLFFIKIWTSPRDNEDAIPPARTTRLEERKEGKYKVSAERDNAYHCDSGWPIKIEALQTGDPAFNPLF